MSNLDDFDIVTIQEIEEKILSCLLVFPKEGYIAFQILNPKMFTSQKNAKLFEVIAEIDEGQKDFIYQDINIFCKYLQDKKVLNLLGGKDEIINIYGIASTSVHLEEYCLILFEKFKRRELVEAGKAISRIAVEEPYIETAFEKAIHKINFVLQNSLNKEGTVDLNQSTGNLLLKIAEMQESGITPGLKTNLYDFDAMTAGGLQNGDLIILAARPSMGKTAMGLNWSLNFAKKERNILFFSLEMSAEQLTGRLLSMESKIPMNKITSGRITSQELVRLIEATNKLPLDYFHINDSSYSIGAIKTSIASFQVKKKVDAIFIDYLQFISSNGKNRVYEIQEMTRELKRIAKDNEIPVIVLCQLNRCTETRTNKRPMMSDMRESGSIEQDADLVAMLYRDEYYNPQTPDIGIAELIITKHRNGPVGTIKLVFDPLTTNFKNLAS